MTCLIEYDFFQNLKCLSVYEDTIVRVWVRAAKKGGFIMNDKVLNGVLFI